MAALKSDSITLKLSEIRGRKIDLTVMTVMICTEAKFPMIRVFPPACQLVTRAPIQVWIPGFLYGMENAAHFAFTVKIPLWLVGSTGSSCNFEGHSYPSFIR
jgi:hypothetical protein